MLIKIAEAAKLLGYSEQNLYQKIEMGLLLSSKDDKGQIFVDKVQALQLKPTVLAFYTHKGGVAKTSSTMVLADYLAKKGLKILLLDLDPQANLSRVFTDYTQDILEKEAPSLSEYFVKNSTRLSHVVHKVNDNIDILPAKISMAKIPFLDSTELNRRKNDDFYPFFKKYQIVLIDCPPSLGHFSKLGLLLAHYVFIPLYPERFSYEGVDDALSTLTEVVSINPDFIKFYAFVSRKSGRKTVIHDTFQRLYEKLIGENMLQSYIPEFIGIVERAAGQTNLFEMYAEREAQMKRIELFCNEVYSNVYLGR